MTDKEKPPIHGSTYGPWDDKLEGGLEAIRVIASLPFVGLAKLFQLLIGNPVRAVVRFLRSVRGDTWMGLVCVTFALVVLGGMIGLIIRSDNPSAVLAAKKAGYAEGTHVYVIPKKRDGIISSAYAHPSGAVRCRVKIAKTPGNWKYYTIETYEQYEVEIISPEEDGMSENVAYCVKCKEKTSMNDTEKVKMKNGRPAMKGKCSVCGTGMYKILPGEKKA